MGLLGSFTGSDAKKAISKGQKQATADVQAGYDAARPDFDTAVSGFDQYTTSGSENQKMLDDLKGLNGPEAQANAQKTYQNDPYLQDALGQSENDMTRLGNAQGWGGGKFALAGQRVATSNYSDWVKSFQTGADSGLNAMSQKAGALTNRGNLAYGKGATQAGIDTNAANAMASANNIFAQNTIGAVGAVGQAVAGAAKAGAFA